MPQRDNDEQNRVAFGGQSNGTTAADVDRMAARQRHHDDATRLTLCVSREPNNRSKMCRFERPNRLRRRQPEYVRNRCDV
jgi:hypothetical protein